MYNILIIKDDKVVDVQQSKTLDKYEDKEYILVEKLQDMYLDQRYQLHRDCINLDGSIMPLSEQVAKGYFDIQAVFGDEFELVGEEIVRMSEEKLQELFPERYPTPDNNEFSELETLDMEIKNMEYQAGMEVVMEMGRKRLLGEDNV